MDEVALQSPRSGGSCDLRQPIQVDADPG
jgi:hypothetical protein